MRILHTSDWHLGHTLRDQSREHEHSLFLAWLLDTIGREAVDALIIAGDVFETANPPVTAWEVWFQFLADLRRRYPRLDVVVIAGNHDSAARLEAPRHILSDLGVVVVGTIPRKPGGELEVDRLLTPLHDASSREAALCIALPFTRQSDLPAVREGDADDPLIEGMRALHAEIHAAARHRRRPGQALVATAHCYMVGTQVSELSERKVLGGNQHALPVDLFSPDIAYVALGHMHLAQTVGGRENIRYCGSPIPLSMAERGYPHQVILVELDGEELAGARAIAVPRAAGMLRIPDQGGMDPQALLAELAKLPDATSGSGSLRPYLEVCVAVQQPQPDLPRRIEEALTGKEPRLVRVTLQSSGHHQSLAETETAVELEDLQPEQVFRARYERDHQGEPPDELLAAFHGLVDEIAQEEA